MNFSDYATSALIIITSIFMITGLIRLDKRKKLTSKTLKEIKEDLVFKQGRDQIKKLINKNLSIPVTLL